METLTLEDLHAEREKIEAGKRQLEMNLAGHEGALQAIDNLIAKAKNFKKDAPSPIVVDGDRKSDLPAAKK